MSITEPNRGFSGQPPPPPPRRASYQYVPESNQYSDPPRYPPEHNQYPTESNERRLPTLPPIRPRDEQQQYNPYNKPPPYPQDQHHSQPQYSSNHPLQLSQQNPTAPPQHIYQPPQPADYSRPTPYLAAEPHPMQTQDRVGSPILEDHGAPPAQRRQSRKISQRKEFPAPKYSTDLSSAHPRVRYEEQRASSGGYTPPETASNERFSANPPPPVDTPQKSQQSRPMPISRLLSDDNGTNNRPIGPQYKIRVRQQPLAARACGFGERDRRVIDPPPILQLSIEDPNASSAEISELIRQPYSVVHCTLWNPLTDRDDTAMPGSSDKRQQRRLMGTLVASPFVGLDENDVEGCFFCFPDLSVRTAGTYSLKFSLVVLDPKKMMLGNSVPVRATVMSESFQVYNAKDFIGMRASTELTKRLKHQGCLISVKKGNAKTNASHARDEDDDDDEDDDEDGAQTSSKQKAKRPKR